MSSRRQPQLSAEAETAADHLLLDILRALNRNGIIEPLERVAVLAALARKIDTRIDRQARLAADRGATYAAIGRLLRISRQAATKRYKDSNNGGDPPVRQGT